MSSPAIPRKITVTFSPEAKAEWACLPEHVKRHLLATIQEKAPHSHELPLVIGWTCDGNNEHLYRVFKCYTVPPGWRMICFHRTWNEIVIDRVAARTNDPYRDGN
jgi:hypothetical protein